MTHHTARLARSRWRTMILTVVAAGAAVLTALAPASHAYAAPSCTQINSQLDQMWNQLEPLIEQYNMVHTQLQRNKAKSAALQKRIAPLQLQVDVAMTRVSSISAYLYKAGPASTLNAILTSGSPTTLADQLSTLDQLAKSQAATIKGVSDAVAKYNQDKKPLDDLIAQQAKQDADLAAKKKQIESQQAAMQKVRTAACGIAPNGSSLYIGKCPAEYYGDPGTKAAQFACNQIGKPYVWAAEGPNSYDCSGLTKAAWRSVGVYLDHYTVAQKNETTRVSRSQLRPGDLVFFFSDVHHVGIYVGNGLMVHAPTSGDYVRMQYIDKLPINSFGRPG
ncbi:MAG TPA: NlpC/P60 family protein [Micromonosporaceae bacterium]